MRYRDQLPGGVSRNRMVQHHQLQNKPQRGALTKPIPRWDVHFGVLKTTARTPRNLTSTLDPSWVATGSAV